MDWLSPVNNIVLLAGVALRGAAMTGKLAGKIEPDRFGRLMPVAVGMVLIIAVSITHGQRDDTRTQPSKSSLSSNLLRNFSTGSPAAAALTQDVRLRWESFRLPDDAQPNNNGNIGPFCCTGRTVTITGYDGVPVGYAYFYGWNGQAYMCGGRSVAPSIAILVSALSNLTDPKSESKQGSVSFLAKEMSPGTSRSARVGALEFKVTILQAKQVSFRGGTYFEMGSVVAQLDVSIPNG
jgi:hypothetical protein